MPDLPISPDLPALIAKKTHLIEVPAERAGQRLDNFLLGQFKHLPRSLIYKLVRSGQVRVNGGRIRASYKVCAGELVRLPPLVMAADNRPNKTEPAAGLVRRMEQAIVFEDAYLLVINKPCGVASHGGSGISFGAIETLRALRPKQNLELVHRLDRDTSGLLVIAKKRAALRQMQALLRNDHATIGQNNGLCKRYLALLTGHLPNGTLKVDAPLHVGLRQGGERHVQVSANGKAALSVFKVLARRGGHSYCEVRIETGRTHQIRVHARHIGHPLAGDDKYGDPLINQRLRQQSGLKRLFLHASALEFSLEHRAEPYKLNAPLPAELHHVLERLG